MTAQDETQHHSQGILPKPQESLPTELPKEITAHATAVDEQESLPGDVRTLLSWHAPGRPFRKPEREYFMNMLIIMLAVEVIAFLFGQYLLMLVIASLVFVNYALKTVPPHDFHYRISTEGITIEDHFFLWQELYDFYFKRRDSIDTVHIRTKSMLPGELIITLGQMHKEHVKSVLLPYLPYREFVPPTFTEKSGDWLARTFPLEKVRPQHQEV